MTDKQVGIRALKQNASEVIALVKQGNRIIVTDRGIPVAQITSYKKSRFEELVEAGLVIPPQKPRTFPSLPEPIEGVSLQELLDYEREGSK